MADRGGREGGGEEIGGREGRVALARYYRL